MFIETRSFVALVFSLWVILITVVLQAKVGHRTMLVALSEQENKKGQITDSAQWSDYEWSLRSLSVLAHESVEHSTNIVFSRIS